MRWIQGRGRRVTGASAKLVRIDGISRDVTDRRAQERKIAHLSRIHAVLSGINAALVRVHGKQKLFQQACHSAIESGGFPMAWLGIVDREAAAVKPVTSAGEVGNFFDVAPLAVVEAKAHPDAGAARAEAAIPARK
jgi:hypothetical protein